MIRMITGTITAEDSDGVVVITHGIGYLVRTLITEPLTIGDTVELFTHHAIRETASDLYGFSEYRDLQLFEALLLIPGVGPKSALQILNQASPSLLIEAIQTNDSTKLVKLAGLGKKTAEKVVTFLYQKELSFVPIVDTTPKTNQVYEDVFDTLITLGYSPLAVRQVLEGIDTTSPTGDLVKDALRLLTTK